MPEYRIGNDLIIELAGEDSDAEYALLRGHVRPGDIPAELLGTDKEAERIAWIIGQVPEEVRARLEAEAQRYKDMDVELLLAGL